VQNALLFTSAKSLPAKVSRGQKEITLTPPLTKLDADAD
jgi:hypothetical protein